MKTCKDFNMELCGYCSLHSGYHCWINYPNGGITKNLTLSEVLDRINKLYVGKHYLQYFLKGIEVHMPELYEALIKLLILQ
jgi:hypothetical protein